MLHLNRAVALVGRTNIDGTRFDHSGLLSKTSSRRRPIGAKLSLLTSTSPPSSRKPVCPKSPISLAKRALRDPLAPAIREDPGSCAATANGSRLTDFSDQIKDLEKSRVRDDGAGGLSKLAPMPLEPGCHIGSTRKHADPADAARGSPHGLRRDAASGRCPITGRCPISQHRR